MKQSNFIAKYRAARIILLTIWTYMDHLSLKLKLLAGSPRMIHPKELIHPKETGIQGK
jgi:hypothetical protein